MTVTWYQSSLVRRQCRSIRYVQKNWGLFSFSKTIGPGTRVLSWIIKIVLIVYSDIRKGGKLFGLHHRFKMWTCVCHVGGYIREDSSKHDWLKERTAMWEQNIWTIRKTAGKYPQERYAAMVCVIQSEWIFLQRLTMDMGTRLRYWRRLFRKSFCLIFSSERQNPSHPL